jgi:glycosyltransferase involved in cell wall biosynthesis
MPNQQTKGAINSVVIARNAYEWQYGGAEQFAYNFAVSMKAEGIDTVVASRVPELLKHCKRAHIPTFRNLWLKNETHRRWMPAYYLLYPILIGQYAWLIMRYRAQLLVLTSRDDQIFGTLAGKLMGVPVVWFDHSDMKHIVAKPFRFLSRSYYRSLALADRVIMTSKAEQEKITANLPAQYQKNFVLINNGALRGSGTALERPKGAKIVAYAGRIDRDKGIFDLAEAAVAVVKRVPEAQFWLAGKGPYEQELRDKLAELGVEKHFKLLGHLDNVWDLLLAADIFVYPTHHDAAPLAPVEAMLAGLPVVASHVGGIPEAVPETAGTLVPPEDPKALAAAITELFTDAGKLEELREGAKTASAHLGFDDVTREHYLPLFRELVEEAR